ncbi:hypothetical protein BGZ51_008855 [Haplosporangium sp. Z 767]|nr:hypothetical protein BGZ51_008855 [Haplosporangium sp. Z 767]
MTQPVTLTTAVGMFFDLLPTVYADENNFDGRSAPTGRSTTTNSTSSSSTIRGQHRQGTALAPEEELMPGLVYVAIAGMTGSFITRQKGLLLKTLAPVAFASAAGYYFLPHTTRNLLGVNQDAYDKWSASRSSYPHSHLSRADLVTQAGGAWHTAEVKMDKLENKLENKIGDKTQEIKDSWNTSTTKVEENKEDLKDQLHQTKTWVENKAHEAGKALDTAQTKVLDAVEDTKDWVQDKAKHVERNLESTVKDASSWRTSQEASTLPTFSVSSSGASGDKHAADKTGAEKTWSHFSSEPASADTHSRRNKWWSSRTKSKGTMTAEFGGNSSGARDHWSNGEEQGTAEVRDSDKEFWFREPSSRHGTSDGSLDNKDVDHWSSTGEEIGTAKMDESPYAHKHRESFLGTAPPGELAHKPEYWSNGEEISSADIRDANYYEYTGSFMSDSLGRTSWGDRRSRETSSDTKDTMSNLKERAESLAWKTKEAAEKAGLKLANKLAMEQAELEKKAAEARARAETAARQAKATTNTFLRERQLAIERSARDLEQRLAAEKKAADRAAADAKARAHAWEVEQLALAEKAAKEVQARVAREKAAAESSAAQIKTKAETWAREQKEKADMAARVIHDRFLHETAAAEKTAQEAKAALEAKIEKEKFKLERNARELEERIRFEKSKEDKDNARTASGSGSGWSWPWSSKSDSNTVSETASTSTTRAHKVYDSAEHLVDHINEGIKHTKEDIENRASHLKDAVFGAGAQATNADRQNETVEGRGTWTYGSTATVDGVNVKPSDFGRGVEGFAAKAERDINFKAKVNDDNKSETARKAYDNVIDAATSLEDQLQRRHEHEFPVRRQNDDGHNLSDHIRDDLRQTKEDIQQGVEHLKETVYGTEQTANKAASEGKSWLNAKTRQAEEKASRLESELRTGLDKAGNKIRGMNVGLDETLNPADREAADDFWPHAEGDRQRQQQRRGSGRAM